MSCCSPTVALSSGTSFALQLALMFQLPVPWMNHTAGLWPALYGFAAFVEQVVGMLSPYTFHDFPAPSICAKMFGQVSVPLVPVEPPQKSSGFVTHVQSEQPGGTY